MSRAKTIAAVGVSDVEVAHLRLLLRRNAGALANHWVWGDENGADLIIVDPQSFAGQMAQTRAQGAGLRCAIFSDLPQPAADLVLHRPLLGANIIEVLNRAASAMVGQPDVGAHTADFYTRDLGDDTDPWMAAGEATAPVAGLDEVLRGEPIELRGEYDWKPPAAAAPQGPPPASNQADQARDAASLATAHVVAPRKYTTRERMLADTTPHGLRDYLRADLLSFPARFALPGAPALTLDPKNAIAHAAAGLGALEPYCDARWRLCDWQPLGTAELAAIRAAQPGLPYARLVWLDVLLHSHGELARHLDPGGTYRLTQWIEIDKELSQYFRIASALLHPARLHEIAAAAEASMADVFDIVNAYEAVGWIEWQPRPPRGGQPPPVPTMTQRLRKRFGRG